MLVEEVALADFTQPQPQPRQLHPLASCTPLDPADYCSGVRQPTPSDASHNTVTFRASLRSLRTPVATLAVVTLVGALLLWSGYALPFGDWTGATPRYSPGGTMVVGASLMVISLCGLGYYYRIYRSPDGKVGGLTLSPTGLDFRVQPMTARYRQSMTWERLDGWCLGDDPIRPVVELVLLDGDDGSPKTATLPIHLLQDDPDDVLAAFTRYAGKPVR